MRVIDKAALLAVLALAGCDKGPAGNATAATEEIKLENVSVEQARSQVAKAVRLEPGMWSINTDISDVQIPGAPPEIGAALAKAQGDAATGVTRCITPEEANRPPADIVGGERGGSCRYQNFTMTGGRINATMACAGGPQGGTMNATVVGNYAPTQYTMEMDMKVTGAAMPGAMQGMTMKAKVSGRRTGECKPGAPS